MTSQVPSNVLGSAVRCRPPKLSGGPQPTDPRTATKPALWAVRSSAVLGADLASKAQEASSLEPTPVSPHGIQRCTATNIPLLQSLLPEEALEEKLRERVVNDVSETGGEKHVGDSPLVLVNEKMCLPLTTSPSNWSKMTPIPALDLL